MKRITQLVGIRVTAWYVIVVLRGGWLAFALVSVFPFSLIRALCKA
jgi:hypothetical protein